MPFCGLSRSAWRSLTGELASRPRSAGQAQSGDVNLGDRRGVDRIRCSLQALIRRGGSPRSDIGFRTTARATKV
jgi:hypothetical protein